MMKLCKFPLVLRSKLIVLKIVYNIFNMTYFNFKGYFYIRKTHQWIFFKFTIHRAQAILNTNPFRLCNDHLDPKKCRLR